MNSDAQMPPSGETIISPDTAPSKKPGGSFFEVLAVFTRLGLTSFGGPIAHLGYFRDEIVTRRKWVSEQTYADLVALAQFLPGPASSEVGIALGISRAGLKGGLAAWLGFTLPSAAALILFAYGLNAFGGNGANLTESGWLHGLTVVAVAGDGPQLQQRPLPRHPDHPGRYHHPALADRVGPDSHNRRGWSDRLAFHGREDRRQ